MNEILNIIHKTIYQFFDVCEDDEEAPMSDKDKLLLEVNKAICNNLKALEQQPYEDCVSRQAAIGLKTIAPIAPVMDGEAVHYEEVVFVRDLEKLPSVETERKRGHWIMQNDRSKKLLGWSFCSECNAWIGEPTDYCSNCGADMREADA